VHHLYLEINIQKSKETMTKAMNNSGFQHGTLFSSKNLIGSSSL